MSKIQTGGSDGACKYCGLFEDHEEFDYFAHPTVKSQIMELDKRLRMLPLIERLYEMENYAVRRGLNPGAELKTVTDKDGNKHQKPDGGSVVMPAYGRLLNCYKWLKKMREQAGQLEKNSAAPAPVDNGVLDLSG